MAGYATAGFRACDPYRHVVHDVLEPTTHIYAQGLGVGGAFECTPVSGHHPLVCSMCRMVLKEVELNDIHGHPKKVFLVIMGAIVLVSLTHLATTLNVDVAKASIHHQLEVVGAPIHTCDSHTLREAKEVGMVGSKSRAFRLVPLHVMHKVVDAFPAHWGFLKAPLQLMGSLSYHNPPSMAMPTIPTTHATLTSAHIPRPTEVGASFESAKHAWSPLCCGIGAPMSLVCTCFA